MGSVHFRSCVARLALLVCSTVAVSALTAACGGPDGAANSGQDDSVQGDASAGEDLGSGGSDVDADAVWGAEVDTADTTDSADATDATPTLDADAATGDAVPDAPDSGGDTDGGAVLDAADGDVPAADDGVATGDTGVDGIATEDSGPDASTVDSDNIDIIIDAADSSVAADAGLDVPSAPDAEPDFGSDQPELKDADVDPQDDAPSVDVAEDVPLADADDSSDTESNDVSDASDDAPEDDTSPDVTPAECVWSDDCPAEKSYCAAGKCAACVIDVHCGEPGARCEAGLCAPPIPCASDKVCVASGLVCDVNAGVCVGCMTGADCVAIEVCTNHQCLPPALPCVSSKFCAPNVCAEGYCAECAVDVDCGQAQWCDAGVCLPDTCSPGTVGCDVGGDVQTCPANGSAWAKTSCPPGETCVGTACQPLVCAPSATGCDGNSAWSCDATGTAKSTWDCGAAACKAGVCVAPICTPAATQCSGTALATCSADGTQWQNTECDGGFTCAGGACVAVVCAANSSGCDGSVIRTCTSDGTAWTAGTDCALSAQTCAGGVCVVPACTPGAKSCGVGAVLTCNASGDGYDSQSCDDGKGCTADACDAPTLQCTHAALNCDDGNSCTTDSCPGDGCVNTPLAGACDDGDACSTVEACAAGACVVSAGAVTTLMSGAAVASIGRMYDGTLIATRISNGLGLVSADGKVKGLGGTYATTPAPDGPISKFMPIRGIVGAPDGSIWLAETDAHLIRRVHNGYVTTMAGSTVGYADGFGTAAQFSAPEGIVVDRHGAVWVADTGNHRIRRISPTGHVTTLAGAGIANTVDGEGLAAKFNSPCALTIGDDNTLYVADCGSGALRAVNPSGQVTTLSGGSGSGYADGSPSEAKWGSQLRITWTKAGLIVADATANRVRMLSWNGTSSTLTGTATPGMLDGSLTAAKFGSMNGIVADGQGNVILADGINARLRKISLQPKICDDGSPCTTDTCTPGGGCTFTPLPDGTTCTDYTACTTAEMCAAGVCTGTWHNCDDGSTCTDDYCDAASDLCESMNHGGLCSDGDACTGDDACVSGACSNLGSYVTTIVTNALADGWGSAGGFTSVAGMVALGEDGLLVLDDDRIRHVSLAGQVTTVAGQVFSTNGGYKDGVGAAAQFWNPQAIIADGNGGFLISDTGNCKIRRLVGNTVTTVAGKSCSQIYFSGPTDGLPTKATFHRPVGLARGNDGTVYVTDELADRIRAIAPDGTVSTFAGSTSGGSNGPIATAKFSDPQGLCIDPVDNTLYVTEKMNMAIRKIQNGMVTTLAGGGFGLVDAVGTAAQFKYPVACTVGSDRSVYVADKSNARIRRVRPDGTVTTVAGAKDWGNIIQGGPALSAQLGTLTGIAAGLPGHIWIAETTAIGLLQLAQVDCDDGNACTADACDPAVGSCTHTPIVGAGCP